MKILKALKKEKKQEKHFFIFMVILFLILPIIVFLSQIRSIFLWSYLGIIELLIIISCINKLNYHNLRFSCNNNKLKFKSGLFSQESIILCDKVAVVHTDKDKEEMERKQKEAEEQAKIQKEIDERNLYEKLKQKYGEN